MSDLAAAVDPLGRAFVTWRETQGTTTPHARRAGADRRLVHRSPRSPRAPPSAAPSSPPRPDGGAAVAWPAPAGWQAVTTTKAKFGTLSKVSAALTGDDRDGAQAR